MNEVRERKESIESLRNDLKRIECLFRMMETGNFEGDEEAKAKTAALVKTLEEDSEVSSITRTLQKAVHLCDTELQRINWMQKRAS